VSIPLVQVDIGLLADQVGVAATDTLDLGQGVHDLLLAIDVGVEETEDELDCTVCQYSHLQCSVRWISQFDFSPLTRAVRES
jgi:hypothetical protein